MRYFLAISLLWMFCQMAAAQDFRKDFMAVYENYANADYYSQKVYVQSFASKEATKATYQDQGKIFKRGANYYSAMGDQHTIVKGKQFLFVNKPAQRMLYYTQAQNQDVMTQQYAIFLDSIDAKNIVYLGSSGSIKRYRIKSKGQITRTDLSLDMQQRSIAKIVYYYNMEEAAYKSVFYKTIITYKMDQTKRPSNSWFDLNQYIRLERERAVLQEAYRQYALVQPPKNQPTWGQFPEKTE